MKTRFETTEKHWNLNTISFGSIFRFPNGDEAWILANKDGAKKLICLRINDGNYSEFWPELAVIPLKAARVEEDGTVVFVNA